MRVLYAGSVRLNREKGDRIHFLHLAHALKERGHELVIVAFGSPLGLDLSAFSVIRVPFVSIKWIYVLINDFLLLGGLFLAGRSGDFDVLYHRGVSLAALYARIRGLPVLTEVNGLQVDERRLGGTGKLALIVDSLRERMIVRGAQKVICVTEGIRDQLVIRYGADPERCYILPNATDTDRFHPIAKSDARQAVGIGDSSTFHIGFVGSFQSWIDFDSLVQATAILRRDGISCRLHLVGDGEQNARVHKLVEEHGVSTAVHFVGRVPYEQVPLWINAFDVCVAPFTAHRNDKIGVSPLKLYEYLACEAATIITRLPGTRHVGTDVGAALLYAPHDVDGLRQQLERLYSAPELRQALGSRGREFVLAYHSWDQVAERTEKIMYLATNRQLP